MHDILSLAACYRTPIEPPSLISHPLYSLTYPCQEQKSSGPQKTNAVVVVAVVVGLQMTRVVNVN